MPNPSDPTTSVEIEASRDLIRSLRYVTAVARDIASHQQGRGSNDVPHRDAAMANVDAVESMASSLAAQLGHSSESAMSEDPKKDPATSRVSRRTLVTGLSADHQLAIVEYARSVLSDSGSDLRDACKGIVDNYESIVSRALRDGERDHVRDEEPVDRAEFEEHTRALWQRVRWLEEATRKESRTGGEAQEPSLRKNDAPDPCVGLVAGDRLTTSVGALMRKIAVSLRHEQEKPLPDNALVDTLCEAARLCREHVPERVSERTTIL